MSASSPTRTGLILTAALLALSATAQGRRVAPPPQSQQPAPIERHKSQPTAVKPPGEHLQQWMNAHGNLTPEQQQKALAQEPGFKDLPAQTQQRMLEHLAQLNAMPPERRERLLARNEAVEHMSPEQRVQFRSAMTQLANLPPDDRRYVARTFRGLRELAPAQRQNVLNSERFAHLTEAQRTTLNSLMAIEPLLPPPYDAGSRPPQP